jgi:hypothetical protein
MLAEVHLQLVEETQAVQYPDMVRERTGMLLYEAVRQDSQYNS